MSSVDRGETATAAREFWREVLGEQPTPEQIKAELHDYYLVLQRVPKVYHELTGGRFTKPTTEPGFILDCVEEATQRAIEDARLQVAGGE